MGNIEYISLNYGKTRNGEPLHLVRFKNGQGLLLTSQQLVKRGLATYK